MYSASEFKKDLLANIRIDKGVLSALYESLEVAEIEFRDSSAFSKREWNTYSRTILINCRTEEKEIIERYNDQLFSLCDSIHGVKDKFKLVDISVVVKASLDETSITSNTITVSKIVVINKINDIIGSGGFASVYKSIDRETGLAYAYKVFDPSPFQKSNPDIMKQRFVREAMKLLKYSHENIVHAYDFGFLGNESAYIKTEFIDGLKLIDYIQRNLLSINDRIRLIHQYTSAMAYIHSKTDVHRDISYSNVMVTNDGDIKVLDFGFSRGNEDESYDTTLADISHKFNPPDKSYDIKTEIYCMGAIIFSILSGEGFHVTKLSKIDQIECKNEYKTAVKKCLEIDPENRFQNAIELNNYLNLVTSMPLSPIDDDIFPADDLNQFSLDHFRKFVFSLNQILFYWGQLPSLSTIKVWIEDEWTECFDRYRFLPDIDISRFILSISGAKSIVSDEESYYYIEKNVLLDIVNAYRRFSERDKASIIKGIHEIITLKSVDSEIPFEL